jgi:hypothetical protein
VAAGASQDEGESERGDSFAKLFKYYAQYEFLRQRYYQRQAGISLKFNPYVVPGFPCVLLDSMRTRFHFVGYVQSIQHQGQVSAGGSSSMSTQASTVCARTMPEFLNDVRNDAYHFEARIMAAPAEIIPEIQQIIQDEAKAESFYQRLFYGGARPGNFPATFHYDQMFGYARGLNTEDIRMEGDSVAVVSARDQAALAALRSDGSNETQQAAPASATQSTVVGGVSSEGQTTITENIDPNDDLAPKNIFNDAFDNHNIAMQICSRPVCTLVEYIRFWHGGRTLGDLLHDQIVIGADNTYSYAAVVEDDSIGIGHGPDGQPRPIQGQAERFPAIFYKRIYRLRPGPGPFDSTTGDNLSPPSAEERGYTDTPPGSPVRPTAETSGVSPLYPQSRADWDIALEAYRVKVRQTVSPST